jgi:ABC-2 type transport system ATP-binding protein
MTAIEATKLTKRYGEQSALEEFDLEIRHGEIFGFLGPNGAGKSTTIDIFLDFIRPTDGYAVVAGYDPQQSPLEVRHNIGILPDDYSLYDSLTGAEHIELAKDLNESNEDTDALLSRVGLADAGDQPAGNYSKGMAQRLAFGMALVGDPDVLILDEPSNGIDPNGVQDIRDLIQEEAASGTTIFFSTHILEQVEAICDRVAIINEGELVAVDTISGLQETFDTQSVLVLSVDGTPTDLDLYDLDGVSQVKHSGDTITVHLRNPQLKSTVITRVEASGVSVSDIEIKETSLTELFSRLTAEGEGA